MSVNAYLSIALPSFHINQVEKYVWKLFLNIWRFFLDIFLLLISDFIHFDHSTHTEELNVLKIFETYLMVQNVTYFAKHLMHTWNEWIFCNYFVSY